MDKDYMCGAHSETDNWVQIKVTVGLELLDRLTSIMSMVNNNLMIEDFSDIDLKTCYGDLIDESILNADKTIASVSVFIPSDRSYTDDLSFIKSRLAEEKIDAKVEIIGVREEDWANSWKEYYKPIKIGEKIVIVPAWEKYEEKEGEIIVRMDPGMAFGTGTHETTRLVIHLLEKYTDKGCRMLDVGTGSGILAICASKLGAGECCAYDIDPMAVRVARENIKDSGQTNITCDTSDLLHHVDLSGGKYDLICANIVADIIIRMNPDVGRYLKDDGVLLASGIILERSEDVINSFIENGFKIVEQVVDNGWCALAVKKKESFAFNDPSLEGEFRDLLEQAKKLVKHNDTKSQVVVIKTKSGKVYCFDNDLEAGNADEDSIIDTLKKDKETKVSLVVCMWNDGSLDVLSFALRDKLCKLDAANKEAKMLLNNSEKTIGASMLPK